MRNLAILSAVMALPVAAMAQDVPAPAPAEVAVETATLGKSVVSLHLHPFLTEQELAVLRVVAKDRQALSLFVPGKPDTFAAMAVSPDEGFLRDGQPAASASALADFPDAAAARAAVQAACDAARKGEAPCVVVLEVAPKG